MKLAAAVLVPLLGGPAAAGTVKGKVSVEDAQEAARTVVYIEEVPESSLPAPPAAPVKLSQRWARFAPGVLPVFKGSSVDFTNDDFVMHNVFSKSKVKTFDLGLYAKEQAKVVKFDQPGAVEIFCSIHPRMSGVILVLQNPYFTQPAADGSFTLPNVPAGEWKLRVYRPGLDKAPVSVKVPAKGTVEASP
ncbi:MAG: beta-sandwich domain-containing protein [Hyalangium sp.]|uniref:beta-sandwich domain-containing protein n=1 Tax=Hyalangium sp. TaxID=2028555 RepID=UPI00389A9C71